MSKYKIGDKVWYDDILYMVEKDYGNDVYLIGNEKAFCDLVPEHMLNTNTYSITTFEKLKEIIAKLPRGPTKAQMDFAYIMGFGGWPGFKVGVAVWKKLQELAIPTTIIDNFNGISVVLDERLDPNAVLSIEDLWRAIYENQTSFNPNSTVVK